MLLIEYISLPTVRIVYWFKKIITKHLGHCISFYWHTFLETKHQLEPKEKQNCTLPRFDIVISHTYDRAWYKYIHKVDLARIQRSSRCGTVKYWIGYITNGRLKRTKQALNVMINLHQNYCNIVQRIAWYGISTCTIGASKRRNRQHYRILKSCRGTRSQWQSRLVYRFICAKISKNNQKTIGVSILVCDFEG